MKNKRKKYLIIALSIVAIFIFAGTYAYWNWTSSENKNVVFNTSKDLKDYITYDDGESKFVGDFQVSDSYLDGVHTTISMKKDGAANVSLIATINMDINAIGETMKVSPALKWVVTSGDSTNVGDVLSSGNFIGSNAGDTMVLLPNIEVLTTEQKFTIWIWIDSSENPSADLTGETLDTVVWTQIDQVEGVVSTFSITKKNATYQTIDATVVNNMNKIVSYAVTTSNTEPSTWTSISDTDQSNVYNLEYTVSTTGTYYIWFKDSLGNVVSDNVSVSEIDTSAPVCTFGEFSPSSVADGETATVDLVCTDNDLKNINLSINDIEITGSSATLSNISKVKTTNGYTYTISLVGTDVDGIVSLTLPSGKIFDSMNNTNESASSGNLTIQNDIEAPTITLSANSDSSYSQTKSVTVTIKDTNSGLASGASLQYGWSTSNTTEPSSYTTVNPSYTAGTTSGVTFTASGSGLTGDYYLWVVPVSLADVTGNSNTTTVKSTGTFKFDNTAPTGTISASMSGTTITATVSASDPQSGVSEYQYAIDTSSDCSTVGFASSTSSSYTFNISTFTTYYVCVKLKDNVGNLSSVISSSIADTTPPTAPTTMSFVFGDWSDYTDDTWTNKKVYAARSVGQNDASQRGPSGSTDSESGVAKYQISTDSNTWVDYNYVYTDAMFYMDSEGTHYRYFRACDNAGNCGSSLKKTAKIDRTTPTVSYNLTGGTYTTTKSVTVTASDSGGSGFNYMNVHVYKDGTKIESKSQNSITTSSFNVSLDSDGTWYVYTTVYDNAGNTQNQSPDNGYGWYYQQYTISTSKNGAYFVNNRTSIANLSNNLTGGMYRYQGTATAVTNNYICFGTSTKSTCTGNPGTYMYRIVGVTSDGLIKLIKMTSLSTKYAWHNSTSGWQVWPECQLYTKLNGSYYLTNTTYVPSEWSSKIANTTWRYKSSTSTYLYGDYISSYTGTQMYEYESATVTAQVGIMAIHDYYLSLGDSAICGNDTNSCVNSWIHYTNNNNASTDGEWTLARWTNTGGALYSYWIKSGGYPRPEYTVTSTRQVRPMIYLNSSVIIDSGTGTSSDPYIIRQ